MCRAGAQRNPAQLAQLSRECRKACLARRIFTLVAQCLLHPGRRKFGILMFAGTEERQLYDAQHILGITSSWKDRGSALASCSRLTLRKAWRPAREIGWLDEPTFMPLEN